MKRTRLLIAVLVLIGVVACSHEPPAYESTYTGPNTTPAPPAVEVASVAVIGDSYSEQGPVPFPRLAGDTLTKEGLPVKITNGSVSGSGYVNPGVRRTRLGERIPRIVKANDAVVVFIGSRNDRTFPAAEIASATSEAYVAAKQIAPNARLLVIGPIWPEGNPPDGVLQARDVVRDQAIAAGATFVDPIAEAWLVGDPALLKPDGVHPNEAGNQYLAAKFAPLLRSVLEVNG